MSEHLSIAELNAVVDGELQSADLARASDHLGGCLACSSHCLSLGVLSAGWHRQAQHIRFPTASSRACAA